MMHSAIDLVPVRDQSANSFTVRKYYTSQYSTNYNVATVTACLNFVWSITFVLCTPFIRFKRTSARI